MPALAGARETPATWLIFGLLALGTSQAGYAGRDTVGSTLAKRGLSFPWNSDPKDLLSSGFNKSGCPKAAYAFTWELWRVINQDPALEFIASARTIQQVASIKDSMLQNGASKLAFLNEPDLPGETMVDAGTAASMWISYAVPMRQNNGTYLISPAVTTNSSMAVPWMDAFLQAATPANRPDAMALHYYGADSTDFIAWTSMMHRRYGLDVWVTEVASTSQSMPAVQAFQTAIMQWADTQPWIRGVFWFCVSRTADANRSLPLSTLMEPDGTMGDLGVRWCRG